MKALQCRMAGVMCYQRISCEAGVAFGERMDMAKAIENQRCTAVHIAKNVTLKTAKTGQGTALPVKFVGTQFFCYEEKISLLNK